MEIRERCSRLPVHRPAGTPTPANVSSRLCLLRTIPRSQFGASNARIISSCSSKIELDGDHRLDAADAEEPFEHHADLARVFVAQGVLDQDRFSSVEAVAACQHRSAGRKEGSPAVDDEDVSRDRALRRWPRPAAGWRPPARPDRRSPGLSVSHDRGRRTLLLGDKEAVCGMRHLDPGVLDASIERMVLSSSPLSAHGG